MDSSLSTTVLTLSVILVTLYILILRLRPSSKEAPHAAGAWPVLGHLHLLGGPEMLHNTLGAMAEKYGPIFNIHIGVHQALVVSNWEVAKECYTTADKFFVNRPRSTTAEINGYDYVMVGFASYPYWSYVRKIIMSELLSIRRLESIKDARDAEIDSAMKDLYKGPALVELKQWVGDLTLNIILRIIVGKHKFGLNSDTDSRRCQKALSELMKLMGIFTLEDAVPVPALKWFDLQGYKKQMKDTAIELDSLLQEWLEEHKIQKLESKGEQDFMSVMMSILDDAKNTYGHDKDTILKSTCLALIAGGNDTIMLTLTWILSLLLNNRRTLKKVYEELDREVGRDRQVNSSDIKNLTYLYAVIKEELRLYPPGPVADPRVSTQDCTIAGYLVPAGTRLLVNLSKIQRDPSVWSNPDEFFPERFLTDHIDIDVKGQPSGGLAPFGGGRRQCPGISFALQVMPIILARILQGFEITTPMDLPVDMTESAGLTNVKATPLDVLIAPRLRPGLYGL